MARAGAGLGLHEGRGVRRSLELPLEHTFGELSTAVERVLEDPSYRHEAERIAAAMHALPPVDAAVDELAAIAAGRS